MNPPPAYHPVPPEPAALELPVGPAPAAGLTFRSLREPEPGQLWQARFEATWPAYRAWFRMSGAGERPSRAATEAALRRHMPELLPIHARLTALAGGGDEAARFLGLWCPAPFLSGCSQIAVAHPEPVLARNYDYRPDLCEGTVFLTRWGARRVIAFTDCAWGVLDGMNEDGLAVSLSFGGRRVYGEGFGIQLALRYVLETCSDTGAALAVLRRLPIHMAYNVTLVDTAGRCATVFLAPDRPAVVRKDAVATNHQQVVEWPEHARATRSLEREERLRALRRGGGATPANLGAALLAPPFHAREFGLGWSTLYTAVYRPRWRVVDVLWPDAAWSLGFDDFAERVHVPLPGAPFAARTGTDG